MTNTIAKITNPVLFLENLSIAYDKNYAVKNVTVGIKKKYGYGHNGAFRMRKKHPAQGAQPDA